MYFGKTAGVVGTTPARATEDRPRRTHTCSFLFIINTALARTELKATVVASLSPILSENNDDDDDDDDEEEQEARVEYGT